MRANNMLGVLFSNVHDEKIRELTEKRAMGSVPFGGRYRLIDFPLSNMVNSGINKVGVITKNNYQSLMDHLGSGKAWDLSRKREGLFILPPFGDASSIPNSRLEYLASIHRFLENSREEYVVLSDCDMIFNMDYSQVLAYHLEKEADITVVYHFGKIPAGSGDPTVYTIAPDGRVLDMLVSPNMEGDCNHGLSVLVMKRELLMSMVGDCVSRNMFNFKRDFLQRNVKNYRIYGYEFEGTVQTICSMNSYFEANMTLMQPRPPDLHEGARRHARALRPGRRGEQQHHRRRLRGGRHGGELRAVPRREGGKGRAPGKLRRDAGRRHRRQLPHELCRGG